MAIMSTLLFGPYLHGVRSIRPLVWSAIHPTRPFHSMGPHRPSTTPKTTAVIETQQDDSDDPIKEHYLFAKLHDAVAQELRAAGLTRITFNPDDTHVPTGKNKYITSIMGSFNCSNDACDTKKWTSKKISIAIQHYPATMQYNARVYNQRCKRCTALGRIHVNEQSYVERVVYRIKKWYNVAVDEPPHSGPRNKKKHEWRSCEGCKRNECPFDAVKVSWEL